MKGILKFTIFALLSFTSWLGLSQTNSKSQDKPSSTSEQSSKESKATEDAQAKAEAISFEQGSSSLTEEAKTKIRGLVENAKKAGEMGGAKIAVWSDQESPAKARKDLPKEDKELAEKRADAIKTFLKEDMKVSNVDVYNMAEGTNWLAQKFNTEASELHSIFSKEGYRGKVEPEVNLIRDLGKPSHAVIVVESKAGQK